MFEKSCIDQRAGTEFAQTSMRCCELPVDSCLLECATRAHHDTVRDGRSGHMKPGYNQLVVGCAVEMSVCRYLATSWICHVAAMLGKGQNHMSRVCFEMTTRARKSRAHL